MHVNNFIGNTDTCQQENKKLIDLVDIFYRKQTRKAVIIRIVDYICHMERIFGSRLKITESLSGMAAKFGISPVHMCRIWDELVDLGIVGKRNRGWGRVKGGLINNGIYKLPPEYTLTSFMKEPQTRYALSSIFPSLKGFALSVLFSTCGYGVEHDLSSLSEASKGSHVKTYNIKNYEDIIKRVLNDTAKKKNKYFGKVLSPIYRAWEETFPEKDLFSKDSSPSQGDHNFYDNPRSLSLDEYVKLEKYINSDEIKGYLIDFRDFNIESGLVNTYKEPKRNKRTPNSVIEADRVWQEKQDREKLLEQEKNCPLAAEKRAKALAELFRKL